MPKLKHTDYSAILIAQIIQSGLLIPVPKKEYIFHTVRKWRLDLFWSAPKIAVEIEGGIYSRGFTKDGKPKQSRHTSGKGFEEDCIKYAEAQLLGITVYRFPSHWVTDGRALSYLARIFAI